MFLRFWEGEMTEQTTIEGSEEAETGALAPEEAARAAGWKPLDEFKGPADKWSDADTFLAKREDNVGLLRDNVKRLERRLAEMDKRVSKADRAGFERAMNTVLDRQRAAVETGDMQEFDAAEKERRKLEAKPEAQPPEDVDERAEKFLEWRADNDWYGANPLLSEYADTVAGKLLKESGKPYLGDDDLNEVSRRVKDRFGAKYPDAFGLPAKGDAGEEEEKPRRRGSPVAGVPANRGKGGPKTAADLDSRARELGSKMVAQGLFKDLNEYAKELFNG